MIKKLKSVAPFVIFVAFVSYKFSVSDFFADKCSPRYIDRQIEKIINAKKQELHNTIKTLNLSPDKEHNAIVTISKYSLLTASDCHIPEELETKLYTYLYGEHKGIKECPLGTYSDLAEEELNTLKEVPSSFDVIFKKIKSRTSDSTKAIVEKKWRDPSFKDKLVKTILQVSIREKEKCNNPNLPVKNILKEFMSP
ncbi:MAG: hypothetical protein COB36_02125 [Alphaproteobacteria bacterium]|nr:MAG: hypothetical protein COB36_02125 [Alphaproteobacteria bacterium]